MGDMHLGMHGQTACQRSSLMAPETTTDIPAVDCMHCLWMSLANVLQTANVVSARIKVLTDAKADILTAGRA